MPPETDKNALLGQLRIDRTQREADTGPGRRPWIIGAVVLLIALLVAGAWLGVSGRAALPVHTAVAQPIGATAANASVLDATGYVTARREATVSAQITGTLIEVLIEEGEHVKAGQVLARLDDTAQRASLAQAQAQLHSAESLLAQYEAQLGQSQRDLKRAEDLLERKLVSAQAVEQAGTQVDAQTAQVQAQRRQIELTAASVRSARVQLEYCTVHAPFSGVVIAKAAQVGEIVSPFSAGGGYTRTGIGTIVDMDSLEIEVDVNEAYINRVQPGQAVASVLNAYPDWTIPSHVIAIIPTADRSKATVKVRIALEVKDPRIVPDMGVHVSFLEEKKAAAAPTQPAVRGVLVPAAALRLDGAEQVVFVLKGHKAQRRAVTLGGASGESRLVLAGVSPGEAVIIDAPAGLRDDMPASERHPSFFWYRAEVPMPESMVEVAKVTKVYQRGKQKIEVLHGLDLDIPKGDFVALMGPSGSGKTTLLNLIGGLDQPTSGEVRVGGSRIDQLGSGELARWRAHNVGFVFQFYNLMPVLTAERNVELPLLLTKLSSAQRRKNVAVALEVVGLADRAKHKPRELSGGQEQRVAIARALVSDPQLLVCDEPTGDLDRKTADEILGLLQVLNREHGKTIVIVTHDPKAAEFARRILHLEKGQLLEQARAA